MNENWKMNLKPGDECTINTGNNELPISIIISVIEYLPNDNSFIIKDTEENYYQCFANEMS